MPFNTYIDDKDMITYLLANDWLISHDTWTDCPYETNQAIKKNEMHNDNAKPFLHFTGEMM